MVAANKMIIGLTGQIGAGKTSAANIFRQLGVAVIDADRIGREVVERSAALRKELVRAFGQEILDRNGRVRRKKLAAVAFADKTSQRKLNLLVHPHLLKELRLQIRRATRRRQLVVVDAALLLNWRMDREVDFVLVVHSSRATRLRRLQARGITGKDALARERAQLPYAEFCRRADCVILNNGSRTELAKRIRRLHRRLIRQND